MRRVISLARALSSRSPPVSGLHQASTLSRNPAVAAEKSWVQPPFFQAQGGQGGTTVWAMGALGLLLGAQQAAAAMAEKAPPVEGEPDSMPEMEKVVSQARAGVEERLVALRLLHHPTDLPSVTIAAKGEDVSVKFLLSPTCDFSHLIADAVTRLGDGTPGKEMVVNAEDSALFRQLTILPRDRRVRCVWMLVTMRNPFFGEDGPSEIEFLKKGFLSTKELDAIVSCFAIASGLDPNDRRRNVPTKERTNIRVRKTKSLEGLEGMGVKIYGLENVDAAEPCDQISWDTIAGYHEQKREIEDMVLLALKRPEVFDNIARGTRRKFESNRPRAILFEGPPGTGKTSCARVIASQAGVPLLYVPLEAVMSKYYGESERLLAKIFTAGNELPGGAIVFLDELDSFATSRDNEMHEATRRLLSVLLRQMDGFEQDKKIVVIAATNRKQDLDPALLSRFDTSVAFNLPDESTREEIAAQYARHLSTSELKALAAVSDGLSGRDIHDLCQHAERRWASKVIRGSLAGNPPAEGLPPIQEYINCAEQRRHTIVRYGDGNGEYLRVGDDRPLGTPVVCTL